MYFYRAEQWFNYCLYNLVASLQHLWNDDNDGLRFSVASSEGMV